MHGLLFIYIMFHCFVLQYGILPVYIILGNYIRIIDINHFFPETQESEVNPEQVNLMEALGLQKQILSPKKKPDDVESPITSLLMTRQPSPPIENLKTEYSDSHFVESSSDHLSISPINNPINRDVVTPSALTLPMSSVLTNQVMSHISPLYNLPHTTYQYALQRPPVAPKQNKTTNLTAAFLNRSPFSSTRSQSTIACPDCGQAFSSESKLRIHSVSHTSEAMFHCPLCSLKYKRASDLNRHMKRKHNLRLRDYISNCQRLKQVPPSNLPASLPYGKNTMVKPKVQIDETPQSVPIASVPESVTAASTSDVGDNDLPLDLSMKSGENLQCNMCSYLAKWPSDLRRHMQVHSVEKAFKCGLCNRRYKYQFDCNMHIKRAHQMPAERISEVDPDKVEVRTHKRKQAEPVKMKRSADSPNGQSGMGLVCLYCPYVGKCRSEVERHTRVHTGVKPYSCIYCDYSTPWRGDIKRHLLKHHNDRQVVRDDVDVIMRQVDMKAQNCLDFKPEDKVEENMPVEVESTAQDKSEEPMTDINSNLIIEENPEEQTPTKVKMNQCPYCSFCCEAPSKLKCHLEIHENLKRYRCVYCGKRSNWIWDIRKHIRKDHPGSEMSVDVMDETEAKASLPDYLSKYRSPVKKDLKFHLTVIASDHADKALLMSDTRSYSPVESFPSLDGTIDDIDEDSSEITFKKNLSSPPVKYWKDGISTEMKRRKVKPFQCSQCGQRANWKNDIKRHIERKHLDAEVVVMDIEEAEATLHTLKYGKPLHFTPMKIVSTVSQSSLVTSKNKSQIKIRLPKKTKSAIKTPIKSKASMKSILKSPARSPRSMAYLIVKAQSLDKVQFRKYQCNQCIYRSNYRQDLLKHTIVRHNKPHDMTVLSLREARKTLHNYIMQHSPSKEKYCFDKKQKRFIHCDFQKWQCKECDFRTNTKELILKHMTTHTDTKNYTTSIKCHLKSFHGSTKFSQHAGDLLKTGHVYYQCLVCKRTSKWNSILQKHCKNKHPEQNQTSIIKKKTLKGEGKNYSHRVMASYKLKGNLLKSSRSHMRSTKRRVTYKCNVCPQLTRSPFQAKLHKLQHIPNSNKMYCCTFCPFYASKQTQIELHIKWHNLMVRRQMKHIKVIESKQLNVSRNLFSGTSGKFKEDWSCDKCPFIGKNSSGFRMHYHNHTLIPGANFKCPHCDYWTNHSKIMKKHITVHQYENSSKPVSWKNNLQSPRKSMSKPSTPVKQSIPRGISSLPQFSPEKCEMLCVDEMELIYLKQKLISSKVIPSMLEDSKYSVTGQITSDGQKELSTKRLDNEGTVLDEVSIRLAYTCELCPFNCVTEEQLIIHQNKHLSARPTERLLTVDNEINFKLSADVEIEDGTEKEKKNDESFLCHFCDYEASDREEYSAHLINHSRNYDIKKEILKVASINLRRKDCLRLCCDRFKLAGDEEYFVKHEEGIDTLQRSHYTKWCCDRCAYSTNISELYERHVDLHGSNQLFTCQFCDYSVPKLRHLKAHTKLHLNPNPNLLMLQSINNLKHLPCIPADVALASGYPDCTQSNDPASHKIVKKNDMFWEHSDNFYISGKNLKCDHCPFRGKQRSDLLTHLGYHMSRVTPTIETCKFCTFKVKSDSISILREHEQLHFMALNDTTRSDDNNNDNMNFHSSGDIEIDTESGENSVLSDGNCCRYCSRMFGTLEQTRQHERMHLIL